METRLRAGAGGGGGVGDDQDGTGLVIPKTSTSTSTSTSDDGCSLPHPDSDLVPMENTRSELDHSTFGHVEYIVGSRTRQSSRGRWEYASEQHDDEGSDHPKILGSASPVATQQPTSHRAHKRMWLMTMWVILVQM